jgi:hypothetical protein
VTRVPSIRDFRALIQWDDETARVVWKFGGYRLHVRRYPGRIRTLFLVLLRGVILRTAGWPISAAPSVEMIAPPLPTPAARTSRVPSRPGFRAAVHCTAPPVCLVTPDGRMTP